MAHDIYIQRPAAARLSGRTKGGFAAVFLVLIAVLMLSDSGPENTSQPDVVEPVTEDWHGNVRRSYGPY